LLLHGIEHDEPQVQQIIIEILVDFLLVFGAKGFTREGECHILSALTSALFSEDIECLVSAAEGCTKLFFTRKLAPVLPILRELVLLYFDSELESEVIIVVLFFFFLKFFFRCI